MSHPGLVLMICGEQAMGLGTPRVSHGPWYTAASEDRAGKKDRFGDNEG